MSRIYTHLADTDRVILELNDLVPKEKQNGKFTSVTCPRCGTVNPFGSKDCSKCFLSLESQEAKEEVSLRRKIKSMEKYQEFWKEELEKILPEFWDMKQRLDRIDQEQSDLEIKGHWTKEAYEYFVEQEKLKQKLVS
jgi:ribosomal protein L40E